MGEKYNLWNVILEQNYRRDDMLVHFNIQQIPRLKQISASQFYVVAEYT